jgi:hypothetical protein
MKFQALDSSVKKQIKSSMKRIAQKLIKLNSGKVDVLDSTTAFSIWINRYICIQNEQRYYNLITVDEELYSELRSTLENIFSREITNLSSIEGVQEIKYPKYYVEKAATPKQINYARYLMNMIRNEALPNKKYTMHEISLIISELKGQVKVG